MTRKHQTFCVVCERTLGTLWGWGRGRIPDYTCPRCYRDWECTPDGTPIPHPEQPAWLKYLKNQEAYRRQKRRYWQDRGVDIDVVPVTALGLALEPGIDLVHVGRYQDDDIQVLINAGYGNAEKVG